MVDYKNALEPQRYSQYEHLLSRDTKNLFRYNIVLTKNDDNKEYTCIINKSSLTVRSIYIVDFNRDREMTEIRRCECGADLHFYDGCIVCTKCKNVLDV